MSYACCKVSLAPLRTDKNDAAEMCSQLLFGEPVEVLEVLDNWTKIRTIFDHYEGWMDTKLLLNLSEKEFKRWLDGLSISTAFTRLIQGSWGIFPITMGAYLPFNLADEFQIGSERFSLVEENSVTDLSDLKQFALAYLNAPYLWGGKSPFGIDCSGFTQQVFRLVDKQLPRDACDQVEHGMEVAFEDASFGDLAYFHNKSGKVTHVGIVLEEHQIIHASGWVRIDELRIDGIWREDFGRLTHPLTSIKRL